MRLRVFMVHVEYDKNAHLEDGYLPINKIHPVKELQIDEQNRFYTKNYYREESTPKGDWESYAQVAFKVEGESSNVKVYIESDDKTIELYRCSKSGFWVERVEFYPWKKPIGVPSGQNQAGWLTVLAEDEVTGQSARVDGYFRPSCMSDEEYEILLNDLFRIHRSLITDRKSKIKVGLEKKTTLTVIDQAINNLEPLLMQINAYPGSSLVKHYSKQRIDQIKRLNQQLLIDQEVKPGLTHYFTEVKIENMDIYEHRVIKKMLLILKEIVISTKNTVDFDLYTVKEQSVSFSSNRRSDSLTGLNPSQAFRKMQVKRDAFEEVLAGNIEEKKNHAKSLADSLLAKIDLLLQLPFLKATSEMVEPIVVSQLFIHDPFYSMIWNQLQEVYEYVVVYELRDQAVSVHDIPKIYELWCYFKMIEILIREFGFELKDEDELIGEINRRFVQGTFLDELSVELKHPVCKIKIQFSYNKKVAGFNRKGLPDYLTPDFTFEIQLVNDTQSKTRVYVDAKFRDYHNQGYNKWKKDIIETAIKKYLLNTTGTDQGDISFIVHSDETVGKKFEEEEGIAYSGYYDDEIRNTRFIQELKSRDYFDHLGHRFGSFHLRPNSTESFKRWFRMLMEYHLGLIEICWSCGETSSDKIVKEKSTIGVGTYYRCLSCRDFWVKSHCERNKHLLIKHFKNYHKESNLNEPWNVVCPVCLKSL
ncbi:nuclease domain-containing protein [Laceyella tengchongensis]|uniref:nuclease domain-containing protein n=1 Tax=Laceyella tengchongensis TaxID=574699 RepID=UPI0012B9E915|nr:hypothetical protein [Laceyella tengchongensis]